ncbi:MAG: NAD(P)-dependent oxidoreductase [Christensenellaceae bacterium]
MKKIIVTGATSMMGIALIKECIAQKTTVFAVIRPNSKNAKRIPQSEFVKEVECDSGDAQHLAQLIKERGFDAFYHFAWDGTSRADRNDVWIHEKNIGDTLKAVEAASRLGCVAFIGAGSQAEYGRVNKVISPDTSANPEYAYGIAKLAAARLSEQLCSQLKLRFVWGRIFSVYGEYDHEDTLIMYMIQQLLAGKSPQLTECIQMWDYLYCGDAARAFYLMGKRGTGIYCVGGGKMQKLSKYVKIVQEVVNPNIQIGFGQKETAQNQVMELCADLSKLTNDTGFVPQIDFKSGIKRTVEWMKKETKR